MIEADSVAKYNIEIMRASRELLRWQQYFATGTNEDVVVEDYQTESERRPNAEIDETLDSMTEGTPHVDYAFAFDSFLGYGEQLRSMLVDVH